MLETKKFLVDMPFLVGWGWGVQTAFTFKNKQDRLDKWHSALAEVQLKTDQVLERKTSYFVLIHRSTLTVSLTKKRLAAN